MSQSRACTVGGEGPLEHRRLRVYAETEVCEAHVCRNAFPERYIYTHTFETMHMMWGCDGQYPFCASIVMCKLTPETFKLEIEVSYCFETGFVWEAVC